MVVRVETSLKNAEFAVGFLHVRQRPCVRGASLVQVLVILVLSEQAPCVAIVRALQVPVPESFCVPTAKKEKKKEKKRENLCQ